jgi:GNAT superfamily N-acetyltransferase
MKHRRATEQDFQLLASLNQQLIRDEGHHNSMTIAELEERMRGWLIGEYAAVVFEEDVAVVAYALYREKPDEIYLRQLFVARERRRQGIGRQTIEILRSEYWPKTKRLSMCSFATKPPCRSGGRSVMRTIA